MKNFNMDTKKWKWFRYDEVFEIKKGKRLTLADQETGEIPYISSSSMNNGVDNYINNGNTDENCISIACYGSIGEVFYHREKVWVSDNANAIYLKDRDFNVYIATFIISILNREKYRFSYGVTGKKDRLEKLKIKLPIDENQNPDWNWIENFVKDSIVAKLPPKTKSVWEEKFNVQPLSSEKLSLTDREWAWFEYQDVFEIKKGFYNKKPEENINGEITFIGATEYNNGITSYHDMETIEKSSKTGGGNNAELSEKIFEANCVTISNNGSIGYAFFQSRDFTCSHDINPIYLKNGKITPYIAMFLSTLIEKEQYRWTYGRKWRPARMPFSKIKLPITPTGDPDFLFMEDYIKSLPYSGCL